MSRLNRLKRFCIKRSSKLALFVYARTMLRVSPLRVKQFADRLFECAKGAVDDDEANTRLNTMETSMLKENTFFSVRMWNFCGSSIMRLSFEIEHSGKGVKTTEFFALKKRLFCILRNAEDDDDVNALNNMFAEQVIAEYAAKK